MDYKQDSDILEELPKVSLNYKINQLFTITEKNTKPTHTYNLY